MSMNIFYQHEYVGLFLRSPNTFFIFVFFFGCCCCCCLFFLETIQIFFNQLRWPISSMESKRSIHKKHNNPCYNRAHSLIAKMKLGTISISARSDRFKSELRLSGFVGIEYFLRYKCSSRA